MLGPYVNFVTRTCCTVNPFNPLKQQSKTEKGVKQSVSFSGKKTKNNKRKKPTTLATGNLLTFLRFSFGALTVCHLPGEFLFVPTERNIGTYFIHYLEGKTKFPFFIQKIKCCDGCCECTCIIVGIECYERK